MQTLERLERDDRRLKMLVLFFAMTVSVLRLPRRSHRRLTWYKPYLHTEGSGHGSSASDVH